MGRASRACDWCVMSSSFPVMREFWSSGRILSVLEFFGRSKRVRSEFWFLGGWCRNAEPAGKLTRGGGLEPIHWGCWTERARNAAGLELERAMCVTWVCRGDSDVQADLVRCSNCRIDCRVYMVSEFQVTVVDTFLPTRNLSPSPSNSSFLLGSLRNSGVGWIVKELWFSRRTSEGVLSAPAPTLDFPARSSALRCPAGLVPWLPRSRQS